jgi:hypothetical protein
VLAENVPYFLKLFVDAAPLQLDAATLHCNQPDPAPLLCHLFNHTQAECELHG